MMQRLKEQLAPPLVLFIISVVVTAALSGTYRMTQPVIEKNTLEAENQARTAVLESAQGFREFEGPLGEGILSCFQSENNTGIAVKAETQSYGGRLTAMVGIDEQGNISGISVIDHSDTPGLGTKAMEKDYLSQYNGKNRLKSKDIRESTQVDSISGATISSDAMYHLVQKALKQYDLWKEGQ